MSSCPFAVNVYVCTFYLLLVLVIRLGSFRSTALKYLWSNESNTVFFFLSLALIPLLNHWDTRKWTHQHRLSCGDGEQTQTHWGTKIITDPCKLIWCLSDLNKLYFVEWEILSTSFSYEKGKSVCYLCNTGQYSILFTKINLLHTFKERVYSCLRCKNHTFIFFN